MKTCLGLFFSWFFPYGFVTSACYYDALQKRSDIFLIISCLIKRSQKYNPHYLCKSKFFSTGETRVCSHHAAKKDAETLQLTLAEIGTAKEYGDIRKATLISWTKVCTSMCVPWLGSKLVSLHSTVLCKYTILLRAILGIPERANEPFR